MKLPKGMGNLGNLGALMKQAQDALDRANSVEQELKLIEVDSESAGVRAKFNGAGELLSVSIDKEAVDPNDLESLEDAVTLAIRGGLQQAQKVREEKMKEITGNIPLPPGMSL